LDLHEIQNTTIRKRVESIIRKYLQTANMVDAFRKISLIQDLIKWLKKDTTGDPSLLEAIEHVKSKLEEEYGKPTLTTLFEYAPKSEEYRVPEVFFEHPQLKKIRVLKVIKDGLKEKLVDSEIVDGNQLKIHYVIGNLDMKIVDKEEMPVKIPCGRVLYDYENGFRYVLINTKNVEYTHDFSIKDVDGTIHLFPNAIYARVVPDRVLPDSGVLFCPSCYNMYDNDEILDQHFTQHQTKIRSRIRMFNITGIDNRWSFCPYCSKKALLSDSPEEIRKTLLFSYLFRSNLFPDVVPLVEKEAFIDKNSAGIVKNDDKIFNLLLGKAMYTNNAHADELIEGFMRVFEIHKDEKNNPTRPIYLWQTRNLRKGDKNIYYYYQVEGQKLPAKIIIETENTDAIAFEISDLQDLYHLPKPSLFLDLIFSCIRIYLGERYPRANSFALDAACEAMFSYILLSQEIKISDNLDEIITNTLESLDELYKQLCNIRESCRRQNLDFQLSFLPDIRHVVNLPLDLSNLREYIEFQIGVEILKISRKLTLILRLFGIGDPNGNLFISGVKKHYGLDFDKLVESVHINVRENEKFKSFIKYYAKDIYLHTLSHLIYRSAIEVAKCDENDVSYDYNASGDIIIYDNYPGGAGFVNECVEAFDNMLYEIKVRPRFGLLQQLEFNMNICPNYLVNYLLYNVAQYFKLDELRYLTYRKPALIIEKVKSTFGITKALYNDVFAKIYGKNLFNSFFSLIKHKVVIAYGLLRKAFGLSYDDLVLVQRCPTIFLFITLCKLDDHDLTILLRDILRENIPLSSGRQNFSIMSEWWERIFESDMGILLSEFHRDYIPKFEDLISTCIHGCYDCAYTSFGCKYPFQEQEFRINTYLTRLALSNLRKKYQYKFPKTPEELQNAMEIVKKENTIYFYFYAKDFPEIEKLFNTFLSKCLTYDMEHSQPFFNFENDGKEIKVLVKLRKRVLK